jgi:hypothetical protein
MQKQKGEKAAFHVSGHNPKKKLAIQISLLGPLESKIFLTGKNNIISQMVPDYQDKCCSILPPPDAR